MTEFTLRKLSTARKSWSGPNLPTRRLGNRPGGLKNFKEFFNFFLSNKKKTRTTQQTSIGQAKEYVHLKIFVELEKFKNLTATHLYIKNNLMCNHSTVVIVVQKKCWKKFFQFFQELGILKEYSYWTASLLFSFSVVWKRQALTLRTDFSEVVTELVKK